MRNLFNWVIVVCHVDFEGWIGVCLFYESDDFDCVCSRMYPMMIVLLGLLQILW